MQSRVRAGGGAETGANGQRMHNRALYDSLAAFVEEAACEGLRAFLVARDDRRDGGLARARVRGGHDPEDRHTADLDNVAVEDLHRRVVVERGPVRCLAHRRVRHSNAARGRWSERECRRMERGWWR